MIITTTKNHPWQPGQESAGTPVNGELRLGEPQQTVRGFGGCFNELGDVALRTLSPEKQETLLRELFSPEGCNFSFCRMPIGASDYAINWYSCNETEGDYAMEHFSIDRDREHLLPYIQSAMKIKPELKLFASPWSPPTWMKTRKVYNYGRLIQTEENLKAYALYFRKFVEAYRAEGVDIRQIHVQNEPCADQKFPSCLWSGEELRNFIANYLSKELDGVADIYLGTINGPDTGELGKGTRYKDLAGYVLQDEACRKVIKGISYQWAGKNAIQKTRDDYPDLEFIQSENECGNSQNSWEYAQYVFELIRHYFRNGVTAYTYWNMLLGENGDSTWGWPQNSMINIRDGEAVFNPEFYVMKHLTHFVKPGAKYLSTSGNWSSNALVFRNPDGETVAVTANPYTAEKVISLGGKSYLLPAESFNTIVL